MVVTIKAEDAVPLRILAMKEKEIVMDPEMEADMMVTEDARGTLSVEVTIVKSLVTITMKKMIAVRENHENWKFLINT